MIKKISLLASAVLVCAAAFAQKKTAEEYFQRYNLLVNRLGVAGVGIETIITNWEKDYPEDVQMLVAKFNYYFAKSQSSEVVVKDCKKFMGSEPVLSLTDSLGNQTLYFQEYFYDDALFASASQAIDKAIRLDESNLELRFAKITALLAYEKESPDMAVSSLKSLIDYNYTSHPLWTYQGEVEDDEFFCDAVQEYCYSFFLIASQTSYECFRQVSEKMLKYNPSNAEFTANLGSYCLSVRNDSKEALKYYNKALKLDPDNYVASKNCVIIARRNKDLKAEKKYLPVLIRNSQTPSERQALQARLDALNSKKK